MRIACALFALLFLGLGTLSALASAVTFPSSTSVIFLFGSVICIYGLYDVVKAFKETL